MRARKSLEKMRNKIKRQNDEQMETIQKLCKDLNISSIISNHFNGTQGNKKQQTETKTGNNSNKYKQKIIQLEKILNEKKENFAKLQNQIDFYLKQAEYFEAKLKQNEEEKEKILQSFQRMNESQVSTSTISTYDIQLSSLQNKSTIEKIKESISTNNLQLILQQRQITVETLQNKIADANKVILNLQSDRDILKKALSTTATEDSQFLS